MNSFMQDRLRVLELAQANAKLKSVIEFNRVEKRIIEAELLHLKNKMMNTTDALNRSFLRVQLKKLELEQLKHRSVDLIYRNERKQIKQALNAIIGGF